MNNVNVTGRLTRDPELRSTGSGDSICKMRLAVDRIDLTPAARSTRRRAARAREVDGI